MTTGYVNGGGLGKHRYARWHHEDSGEDGGHPECYGGDEEGSQPRLTPLEKLMQDMSHNEKVVKELTLGKRIGFYRVRGEIGSGNFSQVKLGIHSLTKVFPVRWTLLPSIICRENCPVLYGGGNDALVLATGGMIMKL